ncbi:RNA-binding cell elongation regulator Jag/EloR [Anaerolentibacter hominis]|uniref:RNA-binding cell elongation regulator Jag/EloR n=1 Tax=Anaerolentibacter hominis TaxID=3079009 RepID=UPI0031B83F1B
MAEWMEFTGKTVDDALTEALIKLGLTSDQVEWEILEKESGGFIGLFKKAARIRVKAKSSIEDVAGDFLKNVLREMNIAADVIVTMEEAENTMNIELKGEDMGILIGKRGQTLDSLQYLTSLVVNKEQESYLKVKLDTENYRERRKATLENLAKNISYKVKRTKHSVTLEPMNPYERRIIHAALQGDKYVETHSEGEEPYRCVVITLKKGYRDYNNSSRGSRRPYNNKRNYSRPYNNKREDAVQTEKPAMSGKEDQE